MFIRDKIKKVSKAISGIHFIKNKKNDTQIKTKREKDARKHIFQLRYKLFSLGFVERSLEDLYLSTKGSNHNLKMLANRELARWHINQRNKQDARKAAIILNKYKQAENRNKQLKKATILEIECYELMGNKGYAQSLIVSKLSKKPHPDIFLAAANLEPTLGGKIEWINKALSLFNLYNISYDGEKKGSFFDSLKIEGNALSPNINITKLPLVSVIMPMYNSADTIRTALDSVLSQTWINLEIIVVDDLSTDNTVSIIKEYMEKDSRVKIIQADNNSGPYVCRNLALFSAFGEFVTCHDADDWSHPQKIEMQTKHLLQNPLVVANTSQLARATDSLQFYRRGNYGTLIFRNHSSLMFRRKHVLDNIGFWDSVRFSADSEFIRRIEKKYGVDSIVNIPTGPLTFARQSIQSLTGNVSFGVDKYYTGARKEYYDAQIYYHSIAKNLRYDFPQKLRPFHVPEPMWPKREVKLSEFRHFHVILVSDFRMSSDSNLANLEFIKAQKIMGLRTGLIQMSHYDLDTKSIILPQIRDLLDGNQVQILVYGETVSCELLLLRDPSILQETQRYIPNIKAKNVSVVITNSPHFSSSSLHYYDIQRCQKHIKDYFGDTGVWYPVGQLVRSQIRTSSFDLSNTNISKDDWGEIIDLKEWQRNLYSPQKLKPQICKYMRGHLAQWPANLYDILKPYTQKKACEEILLSGPKVPKKILNNLPKNWMVTQLEDIVLKDFLIDLDVLVYCNYPGLKESINFVIIAAMTVGVPVVLPNSYRSIFRDCALYGEPHHLKDIIERLISNDELYQEQVTKGYCFVNKYFTYEQHIGKINKIIN